MDKRELQDYRSMSKELERFEQKIIETRRRAENARSVKWSYTPSGTERRDFTDIVDELMELQEQYNRRAKEIIARQVRIEAAIAGLADPVERAVMGYRYVDGLSWEQICVKVAYSWNRVHHHHRKALENINPHTIAHSSML